MKELLQQLEQILRNGYSPFTVFNDWLDLMLFALQRDDERYLEIVRRYKNDQQEGEREIDYFCKAFASLQIEMHKTNDDVLGQVYMDWNQSTKLRGQFFTPKHVASMMAHILNPKGRILDPCCGSGTMLVEAIKTMNNEAIEQSVFVGQDIDITCVKMCALNLMFFNVNGYVVWGDSLLLECKRVYQTQRSALGGSIRELTGEAFEDFKKAYLPAIEKSFADTAIAQVTNNDIDKLTAHSEQLTIF